MNDAREDRIDALEDEIMRLHRGEDPTPTGDNEWMTPGRWLYLFNHADNSQRIAMVTAAMVNAQAHAKCDEEDHLGRIAQLESRLVEMGQRIAAINRELDDALGIKDWPDARP